MLQEKNGKRFTSATTSMVTVYSETILLLTLT